MIIISTEMLLMAIAILIIIIFNRNNKLQYMKELITYQQSILKNYISEEELKNALLLDTIDSFTQK